MLRVYLAEKPSLGIELSKCLKPPQMRKDGYIETGEGIVTWGYGHLLRLAEPDEYDAKYKKWVLKDLPIIPAEWKLLIAEASAKQFNIVRDLIQKADEIVNAGDPDAEGQLLIDEILDFVQNEKPVKRILLNALDETSIKKALADLRDNDDFRLLKEKALARQRADWLLGMNFSRVYTLLARKAGHDNVFPVGRVKTPTLSLVVRREEEIKNFKTSTYYLIKGNFAHPNGKIEARWKAQDGQAGLDTEERLVAKNVVDELVRKLETAKTTPAKITAAEKTKKTESNRLPFSLSALQIEAGKKFGLDPQAVLDTAQSLYEKKLTSYPRSDCDFLPENQLDDAAVILHNLEQISHSDLAAWAGGADQAIKSRAWNTKKITAHHAIIPTGQKCNFTSLSEREKKIYFLIAQNYISQFYPVHIFEQTKITLLYAEEVFTASGRVTLAEGWKSVYRAAENLKEAKETDETEKSLPKVKKGDSAEFVTVVVDTKKTEPPKRFTASTLLQAMKEISKYVQNKDLQKRLKDVAGIGTEATRAGIIKELGERGFLSEQKKYLYPTEKAYLLISVLPDKLTYPDLTALWDMTFEKMGEGSVNLAEFIKHQEDFVTKLCREADSTAIKAAPGEPCPVCQKGVLRQKKGKDNIFWGCSNYPDCTASFEDVDGRAQIIICPLCQKNVLKKRKSAKGYFWGCGAYPKCRATFADKDGQPACKEVPDKK
ncbi:MAG: DNA topoisomerase 3 [Sporomusaceae bacterium]|jgi:DNA topoisomerase-3|nr:DNA topoisomerase 3 [Sporomusaceae bacterium]